MKTSEVRARLAALRQPLVDQGLVTRLYGIEFPDERLEGLWRSWAARSGRTPRQTTDRASYNRHSLENFFQQEEYLPAKWAAARLGMKVDSFDETLKALVESGRALPSQREGNLVRENFIRRFSLLFAGLRNTVFGNHDSFCQSIHRTIKKELKVTVEPLKCVTAQLLGEPDFAIEYDAISGDPVGLRYQVWLDTKKPMNLRPDCCSIKLLAEHHAILKPALFDGETIEMPPGLMSAQA